MKLSRAIHRTAARKRTARVVYRETPEEYYRRAAAYYLKMLKKAQKCINDMKKVLTRRY